MQTLRALKQKGDVLIPRFNKAIDDRAPVKEWPIVKAPVEVIIIEGWCLGVCSEEDTELLNSVNELEAKEDEGEISAHHPPLEAQLPRQLLRAVARQHQGTNPDE